MAKTKTLQTAWTGMFRDKARNKLPPGYSWNIINMLPEVHGPLAIRTGWTFASNDIDAVSGSSGSTYTRAGIYAQFSPTAGADPQNLVIDEDGILYKVATDGTVTRIGQTLGAGQNPVFHGGTSVSGTTAATAAQYTGLVIFPAVDGSVAPWKYDGTTISVLNGDPPRAKYACVYKDYTVLGHGSLGATATPEYHPNRIWFSPPGDPDCGYSGDVVAWDTTDSWIDFSVPVKGLAATKNALLVFHETACTRIRGSTPPPDEDMIVDDPWIQIGLLDPFSITNNEDFVYWCASEGVFRTDGVTFENLCKKGGMLRYWRDLVDASDSSYTFATGVVRNFLVVSVKSSVNGNFVDAFMINLDTYAWYRMSNFNFVSFWSGQEGREDQLYAAHSNSADSVSKIVSLDSIFDAHSQFNDDDDDGTDILATIESAFFELGPPGLKRIRRGFCGYSTGQAAGATSITLETNTDPSHQQEGTDPAYSETARHGGGDTILEYTNGEHERRSWPINKRADGVSFRWTQTISGRFVLYSAGVEFMPQEESKQDWLGYSVRTGGGVASQA
jgi:hypothetical protein